MMMPRPMPGPMTPSPMARPAPSSSAACGFIYFLLGLPGHGVPLAVARNVACRASSLLVFERAADVDGRQDGEDERLDDGDEDLEQVQRTEPTCRTAPIR